MTSLFAPSTRALQSKRFIIGSNIAPLAGALLLALPTKAAVVVDPLPPITLPEAGATSALVSVAYSPDAMRVMTLDETGELLERDAKTGAVRFRGDVGGEASKLLVLPDGSFLVGRPYGAVEHYAKPIVGQPLKSTRMFSGPEVEAQGGEKPALFDLGLGSFSLSPDGKTLAVTTIETAYQEVTDEEAAKLSPVQARIQRSKRGKTVARVRLWNLADGTRQSELPPFPQLAFAPGKEDTSTPRLAWSDASTLVVALPEVAIQRFDIATGALKSEWKPPTTAATQPDPAQEQAELDRRFKLLPEAMQERLRNSPPRTRMGKLGSDGPTGFGSVKALSNDGNLLLIASRSGMRLWDVHNNSNRILERSERMSTGDAGQFSSDLKLVALRSAGGFWLWNTDGSQIGWARIPLGTSTDRYTDITFAPDTRTVMLGDNTGGARIWETSAPLSKTPQTTLPGYFEGWTQLSATSTGILAATSRGVARIDSAGVKWFGNDPLQAPAAIPANYLSPPRQEVVALAAAPDGKSWAESVSFLNGYSTTLGNLGIPRGEMRGRDAETGQILWRVTDGDDYKTVDLLRFLPDGTLLTGKAGRGRSFTPQDMSLIGLQARDGKTGEAKPFEVTWGEKVGQRQPSGIEILEPSTDGKTLVVSSGSGGNGVQFLDLTTKTVRGYFASNTEVERGPWATSVDGKWLAGRYRGAIGLWDISGPRAYNSVSPDVSLKLDAKAQVSALKFGTDGTLAAGLSDGCVFVWTGQFATDVPPAWETPKGRAITSLSFSSDGKTLWSGDARRPQSARRPNRCFAPYLTLIGTSN